MLADMEPVSVDAGNDQHAVSDEDAQTFYEDFSLIAGERDWLHPDPRHERLKLLVRQLLAVGGTSGSPTSAAGRGR
jgi:hypothetical protein